MFLTERTKLDVKYFPLCFFHWAQGNNFPQVFPLLFFQPLLTHFVVGKFTLSLSLFLFLSRAFWFLHIFTRAFHSLSSFMFFSELLRVPAFLWREKGEIVWFRPRGGATTHELVDRENFERYSWCLTLSTGIIIKKWKLNDLSNYLQFYIEQTIV